jgi:hypothetical protein
MKYDVEYAPVALVTTPRYAYLKNRAIVKERPLLPLKIISIQNRTPVNDSKVARGEHHPDCTARLGQQNRMTSFRGGVRYKEDMRLTDRPCSQEPLADLAQIDWVSPQCAEEAS